MIELHFAVADKAGKAFSIRPGSISMIECSEKNVSAGCFITVGAERIAVTESRETVRQRCS